MLPLKSVEAKEKELTRPIHVNWVDEQDNSGFAIDNPNPAPQKECNCEGGCGH